MIVVHLSFNMKSKKKDDSKKKKSKAKPDETDKAEDETNNILFHPKIEKCGEYLK